MQTRSLALSISTSLVASSLAHAQGVGYWLYEVTTADGDDLVEPGESATVRLTLDFSPDVVDPDEVGPQGLSAIIFDILALLHVDHGRITSWEVLNELDKLTGDLTSTDGQSLFGVNAGQLTIFGPFDPSDPLDIFEFVWQPDDYAEYDATWMTATEAFLVWDGGTFETAQSIRWEAAETLITVNVVPAPASVVVMLLASAFRRSRLTT